MSPEARALLETSEKSAKENEDSVILACRGPLRVSGSTFLRVFGKDVSNRGKCAIMIPDAAGSRLYSSLIL